MRRRPDLVPSREPAGAAPACDVFYLRVEPHIGGFRWVVAKSGAVEPVLVGPSVFSTDHAAKISGRAGFERFLGEKIRGRPAIRPDVSPL